MAMASPLFDLHDDTARVLCSLLDAADLEALISVSVAARSSFFQSLRDVTARILVLPSGSPDRAEILLRGIKPSRLTRFVWIQISTPWHVGALVHGGLVDYVSSVRVVPESSAFDGGAASQVKICETLPRLTSVAKLDLSGTPVNDIAFVSGMPQLRELNLSGTQAVDVSRLSSLTRLQSLILEDTLVVDLSCVENMAELQFLRASCREPRRDQTSVPPLIKLTKLRTLELKDCTLEGTHDLLVVANRLNKLQLCRVTLREGHVSADDSPNIEAGGVDVLAHTRRQLYEVSAGGSYFHFDSGKTILSRIDSRLCVVRRRIEENLFKLKSESCLQELHLMLPENVGPWQRQQHDFTVLLGLPRLTSLKVSQTIEMPWHYGPDPEEDHNASVERDGRALGEVLAQLTQVKRLKFSGWIDAQATLSRLNHLEHLELGDCKPALTTFDWIRSYQGLRSLKIAVSSKRCDLSAIGLLTGLEELDFINRELSGGTIAELSLLGRLVNVRRLHLTGTIHNLTILRGMKSLEVLTIRSGMARVVPISNVDILAEFTHLESLDVAKTMIKDVSPLARLPRLRFVRIPARADCTPLVEPEHPKLLRLFHPEHNCLVACPKRNGQPRRKHQDESPGSEDLSSLMFTSKAEDY